MKIKGIIFEDFINFKLPCMTIEMPYCDFKCDRECGEQVCQNCTLAKAPVIDERKSAIIDAYKYNQITQAICFQGLEPFDPRSLDDLLDFIYDFRQEFNDYIVIYTGFNYDEISNIVELLKEFNNIIIKFGRYIPNQESHYDELLGVKLASPNQYARRIS